MAQPGRARRRFIGFAIGRSIWGGPLKAFLDGSVERDVAAGEIGDNYLRFVNVYEDSEAQRGRRR